MPKRATDVCHQFFEFLIIADWRGYRVMRFKDEHILRKHVRYNRLPDHLMHVDDWHQFRMQAPCPVPDDIVDAIVSYYNITVNML